MPVSALTVDTVSYQLHNPFSTYCVSAHISVDDLPLARWTNFSLTGTGITIYQSSLYSEMIMLKNKYDRNLDSICTNISKMSDDDANYCIELLDTYHTSIQMVLDNAANALIGINTDTLERTEEKWQNAANKIQEHRDSIASMDELYNGLLSSCNTMSDTVSSSGSKVVDAINVVGDGINLMWNDLGTTITGATSATGGSTITFAGHDIGASFDSFIDSAVVVTKAFGYGIAIICFGIGFTNEAVAFELGTERGWLKVFGQLLLAKIWVDVSVNICRGVYNIILSIASQIMSITPGVTLLQPVTSPSGDGAISSLLIWFTDFINWFVPVLPLAAISIIILVCLCKMYIKLIVRNFEITCLMCVSPLFFATLASSATSSFFRRFISSFISVIAQILWMGITYSLTTTIISDITAPATSIDIVNVWVYIWNLILVPIVLCAATNMIDKPSAELKNLIS
jgi:hypothetical protein